MKKHSLERELLSVNGTTKCKFIVRTLTGQIVHAEIITVESAASCDRFCNRVALLDESTVMEIKEEVLQTIDDAHNMPKPQADEEDPGAKALRETPQAIRDAAESLLHSEHLIDRIEKDIEAMGVAGDEVTSLGLYLTFTSRLLKRPLSAIVWGASSSGKSYAISNVAKLFPPEMKVVAHQLSPKALYHMGENALRHKLVVAGERPHRQKDEQADATKQLREMISDGELTSVTVETGNGAPRSIQTITRGPIAFVESASGTQINPEDLNRCCIFPVDESHEQTNRVCEAIAARAAGAVPDLTEDIIPIHHAMQRMLKGKRIVIPFAPFIAERFPKNRIEARRGLGHVLNMVAAVALLRQFQKEDVGDDQIAADAVDYSIALPLLKPTLDRLCGRLDAQVRRTWAEICSHLKYEAGVGNPTPGDEFDRNTVAVWTGLSEQATGGRLRALTSAGYLALTQEHKGSRKALWRINPQHPEDDVAGEFGLPTVEELRAQRGWV